MPDRNGSKIPACEAHIDGYCSRRVAERMRDVVGGMPSGGAGNAKLLTIPDILDHIVKTGAGLEDLRCHAAHGLPCCHNLATPHYDRDLRALFVGNVRLHAFSAQAGYVLDILEAFEAEGWPHRIFEPLGRIKSKKYGEWLKAAVYELNHHGQEPWLIQFHSHPKSRAIGWKWRLP
ncbi:MAG: hypothetical protein ACLP9L_15805 [Thermoguttaceae bacterium]